MKAIQIVEFGGPEVLQYAEVNEPIPAPHEVRVKLYAAGVNPNETYIRTGTYSFYIPELPYTPGFDGAGVIDATQKRSIACRSQFPMKQGRLLAFQHLLPTGHYFTGRKSSQVRPF
ncbi:alcohol dehydrogenase catalytic domain-containing protein [Brevibacillus brevis]|uniref:alcohol dehydrogenase catalytic domain-containing protein n=1 Tax=Brevibacillus brevis TaxID=1393 RepID=UPI000E3A2FEA|nr:hypothetical protein [Brevibacillus brevis]RED35689.1 hypothetical protein DES34_101348 [Brevibacillus brevis]GEC89232.1 hypothetical protein BBR01nite_15630 [Brevibacillus brevis]VEF89200.1 Quinone oxidoreductase 1 [Brevibacillus brevis]